MMRKPQVFPARKCVDCDTEFTPKSATSTRCPACQKKHRRQYNKMWRKNGVVCDNNAPRVPCGYCGKPSVPGRMYCHQCLREGFANVHKMFGLDNGWKDRQKVKPRVVGGVRGRLPVGNLKPSCVDMPILRPIRTVV